MTICQLNLHNRKEPSFMEYADLPRVPVQDDVIHHDDTEYIVSTVVFYTDGQTPYVVAKCAATQRPDNAVV